MTDPKIITTYVYPPIPIRTNDWSAHYDGEEENGGHGWGRTEQEAIDDLLANWPRDEEPRPHVAPINPARETG